MFKRGTGEHLCLVKTALTLFCAKERHRDNKNRRPTRLKTIKGSGQQSPQRLHRRLDLLILQEMNQPAQSSVVAAIRIGAHKAGRRAAAHAAKHWFLVVLETIYRLPANVAADQVKTLNGIDTGAANGKS